jgi:hypothetical protein
VAYPAGPLRRLGGHAGFWPSSSRRSRRCGKHRELERGLKVWGGIPNRPLPETEKKGC